jgi:hypothetical protein
MLAKRSFRRATARVVCGDRQVTDEASGKGGRAKDAA